MVHINIYENFDSSVLFISPPVYQQEDKFRITVTCNERDLYMLMDTPVFLCRFDYLPHGNYADLKVYLEPFFGPIKLFHDRIREFEANVLQRVQKLFPATQLKSCIGKEGIHTRYPASFITFRLESRTGLPLYQVFDAAGNVCGVDVIKSNSQFRCVIDVSEAFIDTSQESFSLNIKLVQVKAYKPLHMSTYFLLDRPLEKVSVKKKDDETEKKPVKFVPNLHDIVAQKSVLKKVTD